MSMNAGGLAQMTYRLNPFDHNRHLGTPNAGFASRAKASHVKRLSVALPPNISTIDESQQIDVGSTPRTSRGHLLAGLRTAPKSATLPSSQAPLEVENSRYADPSHSSRAPQTATGAYFPGHGQRMSLNSGRQIYSLPEHVLAPPQIEIEGEGDEMDKKYYDELVATNAYLAQQQRSLQQQLIEIQAAAQQLGSVNSNQAATNGHQVPSPNVNLYHQQLQQGMQPVVQPVPNTPGLYQVFNPMTGQTNLVVDNTAPPQSPSQPYPSFSHSPPPHAPRSAARLSPPSAEMSRTRSPPKASTPPQDVEPLPRPSANAFRRGHSKSSSSFSAICTDIAIGGAGPKSAGFPQTPMTGTFGPGQGQAGVKPVRQPRNPINVHELVDAPTANHLGSKNFTLQRREVVQQLVKVGHEYRADKRPSGSVSGTPASEVEINFSVTSSDDEGNLRSNRNLSKKASLGSLRATAVGAIGSERKEKSRERGSIDSHTTQSSLSLSSDEDGSIGGNLVEGEQARRKTPMLVLSSAEKRKSTISLS